jgi:hypothetical protein
MWREHQGQEREQPGDAPLDGVSPSCPEWLRRSDDLRNERLLTMRVDVEWTRALLGLEKGIAWIGPSNGIGQT